MTAATAKNPRKPRKPRAKPVYRTFFIDEANSNDKVHLKSTDKRMTVSLQLQAEGAKTRKIGTITLSTRTMEIKRRRAAHLFRKMNAYGFNDYVLRTAKKFDTIRLSDETCDWKIPVKFILENGSEMKQYLQFKEQGFEKQVFVTLTQLEQFRILKKSNTRL